MSAAGLLALNHSPRTVGAMRHRELLVFYDDEEEESRRWRACELMCPKGATKSVTLAGGPRALLTSHFRGAGSGAAEHQNVLRVCKEKLKICMWVEEGCESHTGRGFHFCGL